MAKGGKSKSKGAKAPRPRAPMASAPATPAGRPRTAAQDRAERTAVSVMLGLCLFGLAIGYVFVSNELLPYLAAQEAQAAVSKVEKNILESFLKNGPQRGLEILGFETQVFPRVTQVTFIYLEKKTSERKAFWWAYTPGEDEGNRVHRIKSVAEFVDSYLLPTVDQVHKDVTGIPGPLARVQHRLETY